MQNSEEKAKSTPKSTTELLEIISKSEELNQDMFFLEIPTVLSQDIEEEEKSKDILLWCYESIKDTISTFIDMDEKSIDLISLWILGTYFHKDFQSYPYLYINAMRGSGKTRLLGLISALSWNGSMLNSPTEAVLFRTGGTLCIDEFEAGIGRKGSENIRELLNSAYKKGVTIKRMRKAKTSEGEMQVVESFDPYRPIVMANIGGIENVLGDRCIKIITEKSVNEKKTRLVENYRDLPKVKKIKEILDGFSQNSCSWCSVVAPGNVSLWWNSYLLQHPYISSTLTTLAVDDPHKKNYTKTTLTTLRLLKPSFDKITRSTLNGRDLELSLPLLVMALWIEGGKRENFFDYILKIMDENCERKKEEESIENLDISLIDFVAQQLPNQYFHRIQKITDDFRSFLGTTEEWVNAKWMGNALKRTKLIKEKHRRNHGVEVMLDYENAQKRMSIFR